MLNFIMLVLIVLMLYLGLVNAFVPSSAVFEPKLIRRAHFWSGMTLHLIREYSTPTYLDSLTLNLTQSVSDVNPATGLPYTTVEYNSALLSYLKPVSPWFSILLARDDKVSYICPDYVNYVGHKPVIYIYRLKSDHSISYIGSALDGMVRVTGHRFSAKAFILNNVVKSRGIKFYTAVKLHGWEAFEIAALVLPTDITTLRAHENLFLALEPKLNSMYISGGRLRHSAATIQAIKNSLGTGPRHHSYGTVRTAAQILMNALGAINRIPVYRYTPDFMYTGVSFISTTNAWKSTDIHIDQFLAYTNTCVLLGGYHYSTIVPIMLHDGSQVLAITDRPTPDPFLRVRESMIRPIRVERADSADTYYFLSPHQAAKVINTGDIWLNTTVTRERIYNVARLSNDQPFTVKGFIMCNLSRKEFIDWYVSAPADLQYLSKPPVETRRKRIY